MEYNFSDIEKKWQHRWSEKKPFKAENSSLKEKYYVLDMFPYPSGAGLHVGHPLGYIASDIVSRYKRHKGFNVLHPMGYDSFGLPAEQYAIQTGQHPAVTTENNIKRYREQLDKIGFSFDWGREVRTSDPEFYKWTQWIFLKLFNSWYNPETDKAESIDTLIPKLKDFSSLSEKEKSDVLMNYRLAYLSETMVNWCPALGTVLANEEVKDGVSERGGYPVERKLMPQWSLRITAYAERLLNDLEKIEWSESLKESQRNWIGKSEGSSLRFKIAGSNGVIEVFTTRPDTVFGATFMVLAPEHELIKEITTSENKKAVDEYVHYAKNRNERERMAEVKNITGVFTGAHAVHPFTEKQIPVWVGDYVLVGYGTGAVMGVPAHDSRDFAFAKHFGLEIIKVIEPNDKSLAKEECFDTYDGYCINSDLINGMQVNDAIKRIIQKIELRGLGKGKINFRLRDAIFGRQRYWGEPIPIYYKDGIPQPVDEKDLPVVLPEVDKYLPTETGEPPLARAKDWKYKGKFDYEHTTMPGWAGSSWYYLRYMDAINENEFASKEAINYWKDVDLYIGGSEHATGHLLYVRFWTKFLHDLGYIPITEPAKKLINQGMIQGRSNFIYKFAFRLDILNAVTDFSSPILLSKEVYDKFHSGEISLKELIERLKKEFNVMVDEYEPNNLAQGLVSKINVDISLVDENDHLNINKFKKQYDEYKDALILSDISNYKCGWDIEKMSKSKYNVVNPDDMCAQYGADCFRMYEMFLGPLEQSKPWNTNGITGVFNFLKKFWRLFHSSPSPLEKGLGDEAALKILHRTIKKVTEDIENYSFNTSVSAFMICVNELTELKCSKREILEPLCILISPFAPHIAEELWEKLGHTDSITYAQWPAYDEKYLVEDSFEYPVSINGKTRFKIPLSLQLTKEQIEKEVLSAEELKKYLDGNTPKKVIIVPGRIVNVVI